MKSYFSPHFKIAVTVILVATLGLAGRMASAQSVESGAQSGSLATTGNIENIGNSYSTSPDRIRQEFRTNQASTPGTIVGATAHANGGCPAVDGWTAGIVIANGGKTTASELRGCMINQFKDRVSSYDQPTLDRSTGLYVWTFHTRMKLNADCAYPLYREILESDGLYECPQTRKEREANRTTAAAPATVVTAGNTQDPYIAERMRRQGK